MIIMRRNRLEGGKGGGGKKKRRKRSEREGRKNRIQHCYTFWQMSSWRSVLL